MTQSRLTINVNVQYAKDWGKTLDFLRKLDPVTVIAVIDNKSAKNRVLEIKQALPHAKIIVRCIIVVNDDGQQKELDGGMHLKPQDDRHYVVSPGDFLNEWGELGQGGLTLSYMNEPQTSDASDEDVRRQVLHMIETMNLAIQRGISLLVGNWGVGQSPKLIKGQWDARFDDVLTLISKHPELLGLGLHLYAPVDTFNALDGLIVRCLALQIPKIPVIVSEFGFDTDGNANGLNGYKSRGFSGVQFGGWCVDKVKNVYSPYIQDGTLDSVAVFGWGYAASFSNFDVEPDTDWQATILAAKERGDLSIEKKPVTVTPAPTPDYMPSVFEAGAKYTLVITGIYRNLRDKPGLGTGVFVGKIDKGATFIALEQTIKDSDYWWKIRVGELEAWISLDGGFVEMRKVALPPVVIPTPPAPTTTTPPSPPVVITLPPVTPEMAYVMTAAERKLLYEQIAVMQNAMLTIVNVIGGLQKQVSQKAA